MRREPGDVVLTPATYAVMTSPLGELTLVGRGAALSGVYFAEHVRRPDLALFGARDDAAFACARRQLTEYFDGRRRTFELTLAPLGNAFQQRVWGELSAIPYGERRTYGQLARSLGRKGLARAVGAANGQNPLSIIVPCHRVVGSDGKLTGYAGGVQRKAFLLELETPLERRPSALF